MTPSWERRRTGEITSEYLGRVLEDYLGLPGMAERARLGHFDDYFAPADIADGMEILRLVNELHGKADILQGSRRRRVLEVIEAVKTGEFDGTKEESDRWVASKDGQAAMAEFPPELRRKLFGDRTA